MDDVRRNLAMTAQAEEFERSRQEAINAGLPPARGTWLGGLQG